MNADPKLAEFLADRDEPCPSCGYNLRGLTTDLCPECRQPLVLRVNLAEPRIGAYIAALCGLLSGAGMAAVLLVAIGIAVLADGPPPRRMWGTIFGVPGLAVLTLAGLGFWLLHIRSRIWFRGLTPGGRARVIAGCWLATAAFVGLFMMLLMRF